MKVKLFARDNMMGKKGKGQFDLENDINDWLEKNSSIKVISIKQSACGGSFDKPKLFVSVWYEEGN